MLSTNLGKKIKIMAKKPDPVAPVIEAPIVAPIAYTPMDNDVGYHDTAMDVAYGGYDANVVNYQLESVSSSGRKRKPSPSLAEFDLGSSTEGPPVKKKAGKVGGRGGSMAGGRGSSGDAAYTPGSTGKSRGGGLGSGTPRGGGAGATRTPKAGAGFPGYKRAPPPGIPSSRRDLQGTVMGLCYDITADLMSRSEAPPFNQPVDPVALEIPHYRTVITHPMDLSTVKDRVKRNIYPNVHQFIDDVRLIWNNAMTFNIEGSPVHEMARILSDYFELRVGDLITEAQAIESANYAAWNAATATPTRGGTTSLAASGSLASSSNTVYAPSGSGRTPRGGTPKQGGSARPQRAVTQVDHKKLALEERITKLQSSIKSAETQLNNLKKNGLNLAVNKAIDALAAKPTEPSFTVPDVSALPYPLKASLAHILRTMNDISHVRQVVKIMMEEHFPFARSGTEVEMDVDRMQPTLLRRIEHYIRTSYPNGPTLLETPAPEPPAEEPKPRVSSHHGGVSSSSTDEDMLVDVTGTGTVPSGNGGGSAGLGGANLGSSVQSNTIRPQTIVAPTPSQTNSRAAAAAAAAASSSSVSTSAASGAAQHGGHHHHRPPKSHHVLDESDSDTSDSDSDEDVPSSMLARSSTRVLDIVPVQATGAAPKEMEIKNISSWSRFDTSSSSSTATSAQQQQSMGVGASGGGGASNGGPHTPGGSIGGGVGASPARPITPGSATTTPGGPGLDTDSSVDHDGNNADANNSNSNTAGGGGLWDTFKQRDALNKQRDKERQELEERQRREKEEREKEAKLEEERRKKAAEEAVLAAQRQAEEEKAKRDAEIRARREAERAQREASAASETGIDMMEQSSIMRSFERELGPK